MQREQTGVVSQYAPASTLRTEFAFWREPHLAERWTTSRPADVAV